MQRLLLIFAVALVAATPCGPASPPSGKWTYGRFAGAPQPGASIERAGTTIVVNDFAADRAFTSTTSRYDASSLDLISADQNASCCTDEWSATVTRNADGSYDVFTKRLFPSDEGKIETTSAHTHLPATGQPLVVNAMAILPWMYHVTHAASIGTISLPNGSSESVAVQTLGIAENAGEAAPAGLPAGERALRVTRESGQSTVLWYDPCTFIVDAFEVSGSVMMR